MKTYLVNPSDKNILEHAGDRVPIGLMSIAANNPNMKVYDLNHTSEEEFMSDVKQHKPNNVGISVYTSPIFPEAVRLAQKLKGKTNLIAGGYHATAMPESLTPYFDLVIRGEGENLHYFIKQKGIVNAGTPDLRKLKNPSGLEMSVYGLNQSGKRTGTILTSRGCPYHCSFCGKLSDKVRYSSVSSILKQVNSLKKDGFEAVYFMDDVFTLNGNRMKRIVDKLDIPYRITTRANLMDETKADILKDTGCDWASFGIESGNDKILSTSNKKMTTKENYDAIKLMADRGIKTKGFFILGLPGETKKTARDTINFSKKLKDIGLTTADFYFLSPFPGTPIWNNPDKFGIKIKDRDFTKYLQAGKTAKCYVDTKHLKSQKIEDLVMEAKELWK